MYGGSIQRGVSQAVRQVSQRRGSAARERSERVEVAAEGIRAIASVLLTGLEDLDGLIHHLRADAITRDDGNLLRGAVSMRRTEGGEWRCAPSGHSCAAMARRQRREGERGACPPVGVSEGDSRGGGVVAQGRGHRGAAEAAGQHGGRALAAVLAGSSAEDGRR